MNKTNDLDEIANNLVKVVNTGIDRMILWEVDGTDIEELEDTATGVTDDDDFNTIDGIRADNTPVEIKYMSGFGLENKLIIHISEKQLGALEERGMVLNDGWRVREGSISGDPSKEGEIIIGGFDGSLLKKNISYVKIPRSLLGNIFPGI